MTARNVWDMIILFIAIVAVVVAIGVSLATRQPLSWFPFAVLLFVFVRFLHGVWIMKDR